MRILMASNIASEEVILPLDTFELVTFPPLIRPISPVPPTLPDEVCLNGREFLKPSGLLTPVPVVLGPLIVLELVPILVLVTPIPPVVTVGWFAWLCE